MAFGWLPGGEPICFASDVVIDRIEAERFEPPRGSGAHISECVLAVDDDRFGACKLLGGSVCELSQRDVDCTGKMFGTVFVFGEDLDKLRVSVEEASEVGAADRCWHA